MFDHHFSSFSLLNNNQIQQTHPSSPEQPSLVWQIWRELHQFLDPPLSQGCLGHEGNSNSPSSPTAVRKHLLNSILNTNKDRISKLSIHTDSYNFFYLSDCIIGCFWLLNSYRSIRPTFRGVQRCQPGRTEAFAWLKKQGFIFHHSKQDLDSVRVLLWNQTQIFI